MSLVRVPLTLFVAYNFNVAATPLHPAPSEEERRVYESWETGLVTEVWPRVQRAVIWMGAVCESSAILAYNFPYRPITDHILSALLPAGLPGAALQVTPVFLLGTIMTTVGAYIRCSCYRALGKFFTHQLSIRKDHQLVTTGPYSVVRHPSYAGAAILYPGIQLCVFGRGSLLWASGLLNSRYGRIVVGVAAANAAFMGVMIVSRSLVEDRTLKQQFGETWSRWAEKVRYRIIPYIF
ncbi:hypothetical protein GLOTRDRAFT_115917 [Gloeophyllum trabeum ATCC 11539]|uniref:Protein-S-isoprenylcysteine O-methyltransferase n=1 Tax=Gloeophyllum trabeum (strain ATCC 11539 / FP-39264 / Madison 617) TaxID=670483 RepID=S7Q689_GLOTA|nr:uncharacterized protein GLOTRDRAFT_115917 [Gloeophyllum trabeum ATCC 11539]EPQ55576.1 hypothetical protein GLOTRDRAFT_115917 [Gloeophyllum trabeum ATCC 11539]